jgi:transmembrane sensor
MSLPSKPASIDGGISAAVVEQATAWLVKLWSGVATPEDHRECARWRAAHADHEHVWQQLQAIEQKLDVVPREVASRTLRSTSPGRRRALKTLAAMLAGSAATYTASQTNLWQRYAADYRTETGERQVLDLADSTRVTLNTASAIDVRYDNRQRLVQLRTGEILVATAADPATIRRPFAVGTSQGIVRALGTRFTVRQTDEQTSQVAVFEGAVEIQPQLDSSRLTQLEAGQQATFSAHTIQAPRLLDADTAAWAQGLLIVERMRLDEFLRELGRYRVGVLRCDPSVGHLLLSGVYTIADTDRVLASISQALPIRVAYQTRYWVTVTSS